MDAKLTKSFSRRLNAFFFLLCLPLQLPRWLDDSAIASHTGDWSPITSRNHRSNLRKQVVIAKLGKRCGCHGSSEIVIYEYIFI